MEMGRAMGFRRLMQQAYERQTHGERGGLAVESKTPESSWNVAFERGLLGWLLRGGRRGAAPASRLRLIDRIGIGSRQALVLVEADGVRLLVATAPEGASTFLPLHSTQLQTAALCPDRPTTSNAAESRGLGPGNSKNKRGKSELRMARVGSQSRVSW